jgi:hypothetical protein|nr:MAG TPA: hypothetical protein [Caudoviricetes sp.]
MQIPDDFKFTFQIKGLELNSLEEFYALDKETVLSFFGFLIVENTLGEELIRRNITSVEDVQEAIFISNGGFFAQLNDEKVAQRMTEDLKAKYKLWIHNTDLLEEVFIPYTKLDPNRMYERVQKHKEDGTLNKFFH